MAETSTAGPMVDLTPPQAIHIVGIGGAGMSAIASVLASWATGSAAAT